MCPCLIARYVSLCETSCDGPPWIIWFQRRLDQRFGFSGTASSHRTTVLAARVAHQAKRASVCLCQCECTDRSLQMHDAGTSADQTYSSGAAGIARSGCSIFGAEPMHRRTCPHRGCFCDCVNGRGCVQDDASVEIRKSADVDDEYDEVAGTTRTFSGNAGHRYRCVYPSSFSIRITSTHFPSSMPCSW